MSKIRDIWRITRRRDFKDGDEVHAVEFNGGLLLSNKLYESLKSELDTLPDTRYLGDLYGVKVLSTPHLPYIYKKIKSPKPIKKEQTNV